MMAKPKVSDGDGTVTIRVPISIRRRGGRKLVLAPNGTNVTAAPARRHIDDAMVKAVARAFRWRTMLENSEYATIRELAAAEDINESYVARIIRLTLLAPDIVESIVEGRQSPEITLPVLMRRFSFLWQVQRAAFRLIDHHGLHFSTRPREQRSF